MSYTSWGLRAAERLRTTAKNGGWGMRRGREDKCDKKGGCIRNLFKIVFTQGENLFMPLK